MSGIAVQSKNATTTPTIYPTIGTFNFEVDYQGYVTYFNGKLTHSGDGFHPQIKGSHIGEQFYAYPKLIQAIRQSLRGRNPHCQLKIGNTYLEFKFYLQANGHVWCIAEDVTTRIKKEKTLEAKIQSLEYYNQDLERFAYIASHDLHEPLRMVRSFLGLLHEEYASAFDEDAKLYVHYAVDGASRMQRLLDDLLLYNRLGKPNIPIRNIDITKVVDYQIYVHKDLIAEKNATIEVSNLPTNVLANGKQIGLVFHHLLKNALSFNDNTNPKVRITCTDQYDKWLFAIIDNGRGIPNEKIPKIFDIFYKHFPTLSTSTGMGLAICKKVIERLNGSIWATSTQGQGTTLYFNVPK